MKVELKHGSLTDGDESVLVNASNTNAQLGTGVSAAIRQACGKGYQERILQELERVFHGPMLPGGVLVTDAGAHPHAKFVLHAAVMDYRDGFTGTSFPTLDTIRTLCERLWDAVEALPGTARHSVAMVALGAGTGNLGVAEPMRIAGETLVAHRAIHPATRIERVAFYALQLHEFIAAAHVLVPIFPELLEAMPADVRRFLGEGQP